MDSTNQQHLDPATQHQQALVAIQDSEQPRLTQATEEKKLLHNLTSQKSKETKK